MNHRERLIAALSHRQPDRVPIDIGGTVNSSIVVEGYAKLKQHYGINSKDVLCNRMTRVVKVDEQILQALDIDTRGVFMGAPIKGDDPGILQGLKERIDWIHKHTDCAAVLAVPPPFIHLSQYLRGFEDWYCDIALGAKVFDALCDAVLEVSLEMSKKVLEAVGKEVDVVVVGDDIGAQQGLQISPAHYAKYVKPRHAKYFKQVHDLSGAKLLYHTCGSVVDIIEDLVEIGVDAIHPVQVSATGMEPAALKKKFGDRMAFWGGVDTQRILPRGSVMDVKRAVEQCIEDMGEGGGYVLGSVHNLQPDVPLENILAMFEHAREYVPSFAR